MNYIFPKNFNQLVFKQFQDYKWYYLPGVICLYATHFIQSEIPFLAAELTRNSSDLKPIIWQFILFAIGIVVFRTASRVLFFYPARVLQKRLRNDLVSDLENSSPFRFREKSKGDIFQLLTGDIDQIRALIGFVGLQGANFLIAMLVLLPKLYNLNPYFLLAIIPMILCFLIFTFIVFKNKEFFRLIQESQGQVQNQIIESFNGKKTITNFHVENSFVSKFSELSLKEMYYFYRSSLGISLSMPLIALGIGLSFIIGAFYLKESGLKVENLIAFSGFIFLFMEPFSYLSWVGVVLSRSKASYQRLRNFKDLLNQVSKDEEELSRLNKNLFNSIESYRIPFWDKVVDIEVRVDQVMCLIGETGVGKTEFLTKLAQIARDRNQKCSYVFQEPYIFNDTVLSNIFLGKVPSEDEINLSLNYIKVFGLDVLAPVSEVLNLEVGENGKKISGGQAKRLVLIRSLMSDAELLIWDDPFSAIDVILEKEIFTKIIEDLRQKKKVLVMSTHRLSTLKFTHQVLFLEKNKDQMKQQLTTDALKNGTSIYEFFKDQMV